jgi:hypothetical protein
MILSLSVLFALTGLAVAASSDDGGGKPAGTYHAEDVPVTAPAEPVGEQAPAVPEPFTVPATTDPPVGVSCAEDGTWFDNPVMHYGLCVPQGWGFTDLSSPQPLARIPSVMLTNLHLVNDAAFPWTPGTLPFDAVRARGVLDVELNLLEPGAEASTECEPSARRTVASLRVLTCTQHYDIFGSPAATGSLRADKVNVGLRSTPIDLVGGPSLEGAALQIVLRAAVLATPEEVDTLWQIVGSIRPY